MFLQSFNERQEIHKKTDTLTQQRRINKLEKLLNGEREIERERARRERENREKERRERENHETPYI